LGRCDVRFAQQADVLNSLLVAMSFPVCNKKFPVPIAGNSSKEVSCFKGFVQAGRGVSPEIPCIFPRIREFEESRQVRCSLAAQPASRGYSGSLPAVAGRSRISPEMRHQMAVVLSDPRQERQCRWGNATVLSVYLFRPLSGVTLAAEPLVPRSAKRHDSHPALSRTGYHERLLI
jgi:hypothetical protein